MRDAKGENTLSFDCFLQRACRLLCFATLSACIFKKKNYKA